jgi:hypothetical protein
MLLHYINVKSKGEKNGRTYYAQKRVKKGSAEIAERKTGREKSKEKKQRVKVPQASRKSER